MAARQRLLLMSVTRTHTGRFFANKSKRFHGLHFAIKRDSNPTELDVSIKQHGYRIKSHEQLVSVSSTPYSAYTSDLSTSWSRTTLLGGQASGKTYLQASFPLRCFQRLSLPHIATRLCHWRDNRYTRGASTPVLSY